MFQRPPFIRIVFDDTLTVFLTARGETGAGLDGERQYFFDSPQLNVHPMQQNVPSSKSIRIAHA